MSEDNPYAKSVEARRERDREKAEKREAAFARREAELLKREAEASWKIEFSYEVLRAILPDLKSGKPVAWARLSRVGEKLRDIVPTEVREYLQTDALLDKEERKETPLKKDD